MKLHAVACALDLPPHLGGLIASFGSLLEFRVAYTGLSAMLEVCRDRYGFYPVETFKLLTCSLCYTYLFKGEQELSPNWPTGQELVYRSSVARYPAGTVFHPDIDNVSVARDICRTLSDVDCQRWTMCCQKAISCCDRQMSRPPTDPLTPHCPRTWDGFGCFDDTLPGMTAAISCPLYIDQTNPEADADCNCKDPHGVSGVVLLRGHCPIAKRQLRKQHRIQIHLNLFLSFIIANVAMVMWENIVYKDRLENADEHALMYKDTVGCKLLYVLTRYAWTSNFCWMFLEGFHLYRLIVKAFKVPRSINSYFVAGWMVSIIPVLVYAVIRMLRADEGRALKATCVLVPVFGLHLFLVVYRPNAESSTIIAYEMFAKVVVGSQVSSHLKGLFQPLELFQSDSPHSGNARTYSNTTNYDIGSNGNSPGLARQESLLKNAGSKPDKREYIYMKSTGSKKGRLMYNGHGTV
ncbi:uncharacterized protein LOC121381547 [Gigantopelta aegis]|uniref:uncharacterized protein LOC121381547 n=1 Tax=Gigantopelta aegis TaxID=1735272 RepID=UPI001B88B9F5|nr:uncharacterized protein LOC121381547 [Gigantopelta aegis]